MQLFKQGCYAQLGRLCIVQGRLAKKWVGAEISPKLFSPGHARVGPVSTLGKGHFFLICTEVPRGSLLVTLQGPRADWVPVVSRSWGGVGVKGISLSESGIGAWGLEGAQGEVLWPVNCQPGPRGQLPAGS